MYFSPLFLFCWYKSSAKIVAIAACIVERGSNVTKEHPLLRQPHSNVWHQMSWRRGKSGEKRRGSDISAEFLSRGTKSEEGIGLGKVLFKGNQGENNKGERMTAQHVSAILSSPFNQWAP